MKFRSTYPSLIFGDGADVHVRFVQGEAEVDDPQAIAALTAAAERVDYVEVVETPARRG